MDHALAAQLQSLVGDRVTGLEAAELRSGAGGWSDDDHRQVAVAEIHKEIARLDTDRLRTGRDPLTGVESEQLARAVFNRMFGVGGLQEHIDAGRYTDIHANGYDQVFVVEKGVKRQVEPVAASNEDLVHTIASYARRRGLSWDATNYELDVQLPTGPRMHAIGWVTDCPAVTIRIHDFDISTMDEIVERGTASRSLANLLTAAMHGGCNVVLAGGTGAGKTTLNRAMINTLGPDRRVVVIEDSPELAIKRCGNHPDAVEMHTRNANVEGRGAVTMEQLVIEALRMNPDHVIVGEFRGAEVREALLAMSQGEAASISTLHADSSESVFARFQMYMAMCPERYDPEVTNLIVAQAVHLIVHMKKLPGDQRVITSVREVTRANGRNVESIEIYGPDDTGRAVPRYQPTTQLLDRLTAAGFDPAWLEPANGGWDR